MIAARIRILEEQRGQTNGSTSYILRQADSGTVQGGGCGLESSPSTLPGLTNDVIPPTMGMPHSIGRRGSCAGSHRSKGKAAVTGEIAAFFAERGVDPQYLGKAASEIPQDQLNLINKIIATPDDADNSVYTHSTLTSLVLGALESAAADPFTARERTCTRSRAP